MKEDRIPNLFAKYRSLPLAAKAALWFVVCSFLQRAMSVITTPIFTRLMSTEQYGQVTVYNSWINVLAVVTTLHLDYSVFNKGMSKFKDRRDEYTCTMQLLTSGLVAIALVSYLIFHRHINQLVELPTCIMLAMMAQLFVSPAISFWTLRKRYDYIYKRVVLITLGMTLLNATVGVIAVAFAAEKGYARILSIALSSVCFGIPIYLYNLRKGRFAFDTELAWYALLFNLPLLPHFFSLYVLDQFDRIMIQKMVGLTAAGLYGLTYNVGLLIKIFTTSLNNAIVPWMYRRLEKREFASVNQVILFTTAFVAFIAVGVSVIAPEAISLFAGEKYKQAVYVVPPVALGILFQYLYTMYANVEFFFDLNKAAMFISGCAATLNVLLNYVGIRIFGYIAAGYSTLICYGFMCVGHYVYMMSGVEKTLGEKPGFNFAPVLLVTCFALVAGLLVVILYPNPIARYSIVVCGLVGAWLVRDKIIKVFKDLRHK